MRLAFETHDGLLAARRFPALSCEQKPVAATELLVLIIFGACAAALTSFVELKLRIPGHAIVRVVFPMALGLALVPRQLAGSVMGISALATAATLQATGAIGLGAGAMTSLCLTGPLLDLILSRAKEGWRLYAGFAIAGLGSNLTAFAVRCGAKLVGLSPGMRRLEDWWPQAVVTYSICGVLAGLLSAAVWFRFRPRISPQT